ncbi:MAG: hypothetical protein WC273_05525 [Dehalococcoidia bacterium]
MTARVRRGPLPRLAPLVQFVLMAALIALPACGAAVPPRNPQVQVRWVLPESFPAQITLHRALANQPTWQTLTFAKGEHPELGEEIAGGNMLVTLDVPERVVVVLRNPLDHPVRFWVAPHLPTPHSADPTLMTLCLCIGVTYEVPARGTWTRVIELGMRRRDAVDTLVVTHVIALGEVPTAEPQPAPTR